MPQIEVTFDISASGILSVSAKDKGTGKEQKITITGGGALSDEDIKKMQADAETHADEDKKKKESAEDKNQADSMIYTAEKSLKDAEGKVGEDDKKAVEEAIKALKEKLDGDTPDPEELKKLTEDLSTKLTKVGEAMYKQAEEDDKAKAESADKSDEKSDDKKDVEEGEVVDTDEKDAK